MRRRHLPGPLDVRRALQSRAIALLDAHRPYASRPAVTWRVGDLRVGDRESEPPRLRRSRRPQAAADQRYSKLAGRLASAHLSGHTVPFRRPAAAESQTAGEPTGSTR